LCIVFRLVFFMIFTSNVFFFFCFRKNSHFPSRTREKVPRINAIELWNSSVVTTPPHAHVDGGVRTMYRLFTLVMDYIALHTFCLIYESDWSDWVWIACVICFYFFSIIYCLSYI
jgi:hypothetical protein